MKGEIVAEFEVRTWNYRTERWCYRTVTYTGNKSYAEYDKMIEKRFPNSEIELVGGTMLYDVYGM